MANHVKIFRRDGDITMEEVLDVYNKVNEERFDNMLHHEFFHDGTVLAILPDKSGYEALVIDIADKFIDYQKNEETGDWDIEKVVSGTYIDMRHGHGNDFYWWLDGQFVKEFAERLNAEIFDDGTGFEKVEDYKRCTFQEYLNRRCTSIKDGKFKKDWYDTKMKDLEYLNENLSAVIYNTFVTEKLKRRNESLDKLL